MDRRPLVRFEGGQIWTTYDPGADRAVGAWATTDTLLMRAGRIMAVGDDARAASVDEVVDLGGGLLLPGFADGHVHPLMGGLQQAGPPVHTAESVEQVQRMVAEWALAHPEEEWVVGYGYDPSLAPAGVFDAYWLDHVPGPVALWASDFHTMWVNSAALQRARIVGAADTAADGVIEARPDGTAIGTLREWGAWGPVAALLPRRDEADALAHATRLLAGAGITWVQDAWVERQHADAWLAVAAAGRSHVRADLAWRFGPGRSTAEQVRAACDLRDAVRGTDGTLTARTVKFFADGVIEGGTGALLEPYCGCGAMHGGDTGLPVWELAHLAEAVSAAAAAGFSAHIHAIGDAANRMALDAIEAAIRTHGREAVGRPVIAHTQLVDAADLGRFASLGVTANFEPLWACLDPAQRELTAPRLGPQRADRQYQIATMLRSGAPVSFGSDWPVSSFDPRAGIAMACTRQWPGQPPWTAHERIGIAAAVAAYTVGVARQAGDEAERGQLAPGMRADLVWLAPGVDGAPLGEVLGTWCGGVRTCDGGRIAP